MVSKLNNSLYEENELIEIKVPVTLPYQSNWVDFERYDGEVEINGVHYSYVKRKIENDTLILLCLPNTDKMKLNSARVSYLSLVNDLQNSDTGKSVPPSSGTIKFVLSEYNTVETYTISPLADAGMSIPYTITSDPVISAYIETPAQPPEEMI